MVQGLIQIVNKRYTVKKPLGVKKKNFNKVEGWLKNKWKSVVIALILLTSVFIFIGVILYINMSSSTLCHKDRINIHIIPYVSSHIDLHINPENYISDLQYFLNYVVDELEANEKRRFTLTETYVLMEWSKNKSDEIQNRVKKLIHEGRLEIAGGGWCITDEGLVHYNSYIDQFTWGMRRLEEFAERQIVPDVAFLMDNHGHSSEIASLMYEMGIRGIMLGGISPQHKCYLKAHRMFEFLWINGSHSKSQAVESSLIASILHDRGLKLNSYLANDPVVIDVTNFFENALCQSTDYQTKNIFMPVGGSFKFHNNKNSFHIIEYLMSLARNNSKLNIVYSTPSYYLDSVQQSINQWYKLHANFQPFSYNKLEYWTGYFSSRPTLKYLERITSLYLQILKQLHTFGGHGLQDSNLNTIREIVGLCQHHQGVAGVCSQATAEYLTRSLYGVITGLSNYTNLLLRNLTVANNDSLELHYESCLQLNISQCNISERNKNFIVSVYNPSSWVVSQYVRIPVTGNNYTVRTHDGQNLETQIVDISRVITSLQSREGVATKELVFRASNIPALGYKSYYLSCEEGSKERKEDIVNTTRKNIQLHFNNLSRKIEQIERQGKNYSFSQDLKFYMSWMSKNSVFKPEKNSQAISDRVETKLLNDGDLVTEYEQSFSSWAAQIIRIYKDEDFVEFQWIVGPIPISFVEGKEVISSFSTNIKNAALYYVDVNGRGIAEKYRNVNREDTFNPEEVARNYCPVNSHLAITDPSTQLHVFNDRPQGGTTVCEGQLELMIHRRLINLNFFNKEDNLNEKAYAYGLVASGRHWVFIGDKEDSKLNRSINDFGARSHSETWPFFAPANDISYDEWKKKYINEFSGLTLQLPKAIKILTLEPWKAGKILLRLEHTGDEGSETLSVNLKDLFAVFEINNVTEVTLSGTSFKRVNLMYPKFTSNAGWNNSVMKKIENFVILNPKEIKTFIVEKGPKK